MLRSGFLLGVGGPAAILTLLVLPSVRASADRLIQDVAPSHAPASQLPGVMRPAAFEISPIHGSGLHLATMPRPEPSAARAPVVTTGPAVSEKEMPKAKRLTREGCEAPLSSLVGPEARRMVPGRCMA